MRTIWLPTTVSCLFLVAQNQIVSDLAEQDVTVCIDAYPDSEVDIFRISAADDILRLLADAHDADLRFLN